MLAFSFLFGLFYFWFASYMLLWGQIFDTGSLQGPFGSFKVCDVQIYGGFVVHIGSFGGGTDKFSVGAEVVCKVTSFYHLSWNEYMNANCLSCIC